MIAGEQKQRAGSPLPAPIGVAIVEDAIGIRESLVAFLNRAPGYTCVGAYADAESALPRLKEQDAQVILMDINLPGASGIETTWAVKRARPDARIVMLTVYEESKALFESLKAGACGYLLKRTPPEKILEAISEAHAGGVPLNPQMAAKVANYFSKWARPKRISTRSPRASARPSNCWRRVFSTRKLPSAWASAPGPSTNSPSRFTRNCTSTRGPKRW